MKIRTYTKEELDSAFKRTMLGLIIALLCGGVAVALMITGGLTRVGWLFNIGGVLIGAGIVVFFYPLFEWLNMRADNADLKHHDSGNPIVNSASVTTGSPLQLVFVGFGVFIVIISIADLFFG